MNLLTKADLMPFCYGQERRNLAEPFTIGEFTYATNTHIVVRVPKLEDAAMPERPVRADFIFEKWRNDGEWLDIPELPACQETQDCEHCGGLGERECDMGHEHDCDECDGSGRGEPKAQPIKIGGAYINDAYLRLIRDHLPNAKLLPNSDPLVVVQIKFDGGVGAVMPMRV